LSEKNYLKITERMAYRAVGTTYPNPPVGAIIVKNGIILSRGWTQPKGVPHAEIHAINQIKNKKDIKGAHLYCTLEPCSHEGKTSPCVNKIIDLEFSKVIISQLDKNPLVNSNSIKKLKSAGIKVVIKNFSNQIKHLNNIFFKSLIKNRPFITLKIASTADGKIATKLYESKWITNPVSRMIGHKLRSLNECMIVGTGTITKDNPVLDCRLDGLGNRSPDIFILDRKLILKRNLKIFGNKNRKIYVFHSDKIKTKNIKLRNVNYIEIKEVNNALDINSIIKKISNLGYMRILVEGGAKLSTSLLNKNLIDEIAWFRASKIIGNNGLNAISNLNIENIEHLKKFKLISNKIIDNDQLSLYRKK
jgi:diaminohydroxyphosphoribosylaminopyrimidine deaminase/5-amino-6-(5-phosphoribosylamino)uracil reductase